MDKNNTMVVKKILQYISEISNMEISSWTHFKSICQIIDNTFEKIYEELKLERSDLKESIDTVFDTIHRKIDLIDISRHEYDDELNEYVNQIEQLFSRYLEKSKRPCYVGDYNYDNILDDFPKPLQEIGYEAMRMYRSEHICIDGDYVYSLEGLPRFQVKNFVPNILDELQKRDMLKSLYIYHCNNLALTLVEMFLNQSQSIIGKYDSFANDYAKTKQWDKIYKSLYIDSSDGNCMQFENKHNEKNISTDGNDRMDNDFRINLTLSSTGYIRFAIENMNDFSRNRAIVNISLPCESHQKDRLTFENFDELANIFDSLWKSSLTINNQKNEEYSNLLPMGQRLYNRNKYKDKCKSLKTPNAIFFPSIQYTVDYWACIITKLDEEITYEQIADFRNKLQSYLDEQLSLGNEVLIDPVMKYGLEYLFSALDNSGITVDKDNFYDNLIKKIGTVRRTKTGVDEAEAIGQNYFYDVVIPENIKTTFDYWTFIIQRENEKLFTPDDLSIIRPRFCRSMSKWIESHPGQPVYITKSEILSSYNKIHDHNSDEDDFFKHVFHSENEIADLEYIDNYTMTDEYGVEIYNQLEQENRKKR